MKPEIHPAYKKIKIACSCGQSFEVGSTSDKDKIQVEICSKCHPFYTGTQKLMDTAGRVEKFKSRVAAGQKAKEAKVAKETAKKAKSAESEPVEAE
jgi:large subunit ribosomal protein L31